MTVPIDFLERLKAVWSLADAPAALGNGLAYAKGMHGRPLDYYISRIASLGLKGQRVLDAGCGTGTWSFALRSAFDEVVGLDYTEERVRVAQWLAEKADVPGMEFRVASVLDTGLPDASVDAVFCYSVLISSLSVKDTLREFHRVLKPGGVVYVSFNGIGWSYYLRDERGRQDPKLDQMGRQGIYNTMVRSLPDHEISAIYSRKAAETGEEVAQLPEPPADPPTRLWPRAVKWLQRVTQQTSVVKPVAPSPSFQARAELDDWILYLSPLGMPPCRLEQVVETIAKECGDSYIVELADDISRLARREPNFAFSHTNAGRGYTPDEIETICNAVGLTDFQWAVEGMILGSNLPAPSKPIHQGYVGPNLKVWDFLAFRPDDTLAERVEPDWFRNNTRAMAHLPYSAAARLPLVTNVDAATMPRGWVEEARRRAEAAGGDRLIGALAGKLCAGALNDEEKVARIIRFVQDTLVHHPVVQPFAFNGAAVTDPATLLFLGIGRCGAAAPIAAALCNEVGLPARVESLGEHILVVTNVGGAEILVETDVFKKGVIPRGADGRLMRYDQFVGSPRLADGLPDFSKWWTIHFRNYADIWGRRPYGYTDSDERMRIYSSYFERNARLRYKPKSPVLCAERRNGRLSMSWDDAIPIDGAEIEYRVVVRKQSRGWNYETEPEDIAPILSPPAANFELWVDGTNTVEFEWPEAGYLEVTPRLKDRPDVFCWPSDEIRVDAAET